MVGAEGVARIRQRERCLDLRHVRGELLAFRAYSELLRTSPQRHGRHSRALCKNVAYPSALSDHLYRLYQGSGVSKLQLNTAGVLSGDYAVFEALHGKGDGPACGYGVDPVLVTQLGRLTHGHEVIDVQIGAERRKRLVLGPAVGRIDLIRPISRYDSLAPHCAGPAGLVLLENRLPHSRARYLVGTPKRTGHPIVRGKPAHLII